MSVFIFSFLRVFVENWFNCKKFSPHGLAGQHNKIYSNTNQLQTLTGSPPIPFSLEHAISDEPII